MFFKGFVGAGSCYIIKIYRVHKMKAVSEYMVTTYLRSIRIFVERTNVFVDELYNLIIAYFIEGCCSILSCYVYVGLTYVISDQDNI